MKIRAVDKSVRHHILIAMHAVSKPTTVDSIRISHPDRLIYPGITKLDLARYCESIGEWILPHVTGRPLTLVHCPGGISGRCAYMRHSKVWGPSALRRVRIPEKTKVGEYLVAESVKAVIALVQMGVVEIHTWNSRVGDIERPDRIVWDLDPGPEVGWSQVVSTARQLRTLLDVLGLQCWVKTTGGRGLHVVLPLRRERSWSECLAFSRHVGEAMVGADPGLLTTAFAKAGRERKILIDYLRNNRTNTSICAYSPRARPGAAVSMPIAWSELTVRLRPERFTVQTVPKRLRQLRADPWSGYWKTSQRISAKVFAAVAGLRG
jgi:bifunctional non-homologous end joining protein LigD